MLTMTFLAAQSQFRTLIDTAQRQPVAVTRRGRPVAVVQSYDDYMANKQGIPFRVVALIAETHSLCAQSEQVNGGLADLFSRKAPWDVKGNTPRS